MFAGLPRFLGQNDKLSLPVSFNNTTSSSKSLQLKVQVTDALQLNSTSITSISIPPSSKSSTYVDISTTAKVGTALISLIVSGAEEYKQVTEIAVRPNYPLQSQSRSGSIAAGETINLDYSRAYALPPKVTVSAADFPSIQLANKLQYLIRYPYGCAEQTISTAFPQLYVEELLKYAAPAKASTNQPRYYINEAIAKLSALRTYGGGISMWPGGSADPFTSVYAAHFLVEADKAGYKINRSMLASLLTYVGGTLNSKYNLQTRYMNNYSKREQYIPLAKLYGVYVLALANKPDRTSMNFYRSHSSELSSTQRYLLAGAYAHAGDWSAYSQLLPKEFRSVDSERALEGDFSSPIRDNAIMLHTLVAVQPNNNKIPGMVDYLISKSDQAINTQDASWLFLALGKVAKQNSQSAITFELSSGGKVLETGKRVNFSVDEGGNYKLSAKGSGRAYYFASSTGVPLTDSSIYKDNELRVRRKYYTSKGQQLTSPLKAGETIVGEIILSSSNRDVPNIAVSDLLPAGFELINERLYAGSSFSWIPEATLRPEYVDYRDDRLLLFLDLGANKTVRYFYTMRAKTSGVFSIPTIGAEAMYNPAISSVSGGGTVTIATGINKPN